MSSGIGSLNSKLGTNTSNSSSSDSIHTKTHDKSRTNIPTNTNTNSPKPSSTSEINRSATLLKQKLEAEENLFKKLISELQSQRDDDNLKFACLLIFNRLENLQKHRRLEKRDLVEFYQLISIRFVIKLLKYGDGENEQSKQNNNQSSEVKIEKSKDEKSGGSKTENKDKDNNNDNNDLSDFVMLAIQILRNIFNLQMTRESFMEHFDIKLLSREDKNLLVRKYPEIFMDRLDYLSKKNRPFDVVYYLHSNYVLEDTVAENFSEKGLPNGFGDIDI